MLSELGTREHFKTFLKLHDPCHSVLLVLKHWRNVQSETGECSRTST